MEHDNRLDSYHRPPEMPRERLWARIVEADARTDLTARRWPRGLGVAAGVALMLACGGAGFVLGRASSPAAAMSDNATSASSSVAAGEPERTIVWF